MQHTGNSSNRIKFMFYLVGAAHYNLVVSVLEVFGCDVVASILMEEAAIFDRFGALKLEIARL